jgi:dipeptidase E
MKLLLTSNGLSNRSIAEAFVDLVGKAPKDIKVAFIPTAGLVDVNDKAWLINDMYRIHKLGCYVDIVDIAQLNKDNWLPRVEAADVIFVGGGNSFYLSYWLQKSGLFEMLPRLLKTRVYVGISAGSMVTGPGLKVASAALRKFGTLKDDEYDELGPPGQSSAKTLKFVDFLFRPHLNSPHFPEIRAEKFIRKVAQSLAEPIYAIDDESALKVVNGKVEVVSESEWVLLNEIE